MAPAAAGLALSLGASGRSTLRESALSSSLTLNSSPLQARINSNAHHGSLCSSSVRLQAYSSRGGSKGTPGGYLYARDRVVDFGKNKGSMLGTLSSRYLRWMTKNLKGTMLTEWADYAQEVLDDPLYMDRIEWEKVEKLLVQSHDLAQLSNSRDALAPARMYGWDIDNESAWSGVNFALLGTTKGGKIPRKPVVKEAKPAKPKTPRKTPATRISKAVAEQEEDVRNKWLSTPVQDGGSLREELERRRQARRDRLSAQREALLEASTGMKETNLNLKFPGRQGILTKVQSSLKSKPQQ